jgi:hypothetical protein
LSHQTVQLPSWPNPVAQTIGLKCLQIGISTSDLVPGRTNKVGSGGLRTDAPSRRVSPIGDPILETQAGSGSTSRRSSPKPLADEVVQAADVVILVPPG